MALPQEMMSNEDPRIEHAAKSLYDEMQHIDPCGEPSWDELIEGDKHVYRLYVEVVLASLGIALPA